MTASEPLYTETDPVVIAADGDRLVRGIIAAVRARNMVMVVSRLHTLAVVDPQRAEEVHRVILAGIELGQANRDG